MNPLALALVLSLTARAAQEDAQEPQAGAETPADPHRLAPPATRAELVREAALAVDEGLAFLVRTQNDDGSWGSHDPKVANLKDFGFGTAMRGCQDAVRAACTAVCASALLAQPARTAEQEAALAKAVEDLLRTDKFAYEHGQTFNTWGYGYKLDFLARLARSPYGADLAERAVKAADVCIQGLRRYQQADGGWNYYSTAMSGGESMSFNTANFALALMRAREAGFDVPRGIAADAVRLLHRMRTARGGVVYDARFLLDPGSVNELSAGSRTVVTAVTLHHAGVLERGDLVRSMEVFNEGENYLEDGRKLIVPHTAVHQISGYFFFYGYEYAAELAELLGASVPEERWDRFAWTMLRTQEDDGSWWDTAAADYGDKWGTGFALRVLQRYLARADAADAAGATGGANPRGSR